MKPQSIVFYHWLGGTTRLVLIDNAAEQPFADSGLDIPSLFVTALNPQLVLAFNQIPYEFHGVVEGRS
jgi:hypothetical protein